MPVSFDFGLLAFPDVQQLDLTAPYEIFASAEQATVHLLWKDREPIRSSTGLWLRPTTSLADCPPLDVLCVPGGNGVNALMQDQELLEFIRHHAATVRYLTSVCTGSLVLGAAGLLKGRRATTHWNAHDLLERFGAIPTQGRVVRDGNLITAGGVTSGIDFGLTVLAELCGSEKAQSVQLGLEYAPEPPFNAGTPDSAPAEIVDLTCRRLAASRQRREQLLSKWLP